MNESEITKWKKAIDNMSHGGMASLRRFALAGHPVFDKRLPLYEYFEKRFQKLGGMTSKISKEIGW